MTATLTSVRSRPVEIAFNRGRHWRAKIGFVVLAMEQTVEDDVFRLTPDGVGVHFSRVPMSNEATVDTLATMAPDIAQAASLILPETGVDVLCYTCNSGTMVIGEAGVIRSLRAARQQVEPTTVMTGVVRALKALGARTIAVATPYLDEVNTVVRDFLEDHGFHVVEIQGMNIRNNSEIDAVDPHFIRAYARSVDRPEAEAIFICCGALRALDVVADLEGDLGKPVVVSNQAMMWDCLRVAGVGDQISGFGRLFELGVTEHHHAVGALAQSSAATRSQTE
jgi:maleate isomerase